MLCIFGGLHPQKLGYAKIWVENGKKTVFMCKTAEKKTLEVHLG